MANFDNGVYSYIVGTATVYVQFPVDYRGNADVKCDMCKYYGRSGKMCLLNKEIVEYPEKFIGSQCPLIFDNNKGETEL